MREGFYTMHRPAYGDQLPKQHAGREADRKYPQNKNKMRLPEQHAGCAADRREKPPPVRSFFVDSLGQHCVNFSEPWSES